MKSFANLGFHVIGDLPTSTLRCVKVSISDDTDFDGVIEENACQAAILFGGTAKVKLGLD